MTTLKCYAPGDGALAFTYVEERFDRIEGQFTQLTTSDAINRDAIEKYIEQTERFKDYLIVQMNEPRTYEGIKEIETWPESKGRKRKHPVMVEQKVTITVPPIYRLCAPVFRVGPDSVRLGDTVYKYSVDQENIFWTRDKEYTDHNLSIRWHFYVTDNEGKVLADDEDREVKNLSTRAAIRWFLNNEKRIVQQYPQQDETTSATVAQLQEAIQNLQRAGMTPDDIFKLSNFVKVD